MNSVFELHSLLARSGLRRSKRNNRTRHLSSAALRSNWPCAQLCQGEKSCKDRILDPLMLKALTSTPRSWRTRRLLLRRRPRQNDGKRRVREGIVFNLTNNPRKIPKKRKSKYPYKSVGKKTKFQMRLVWISISFPLNLGRPEKTKYLNINIPYILIFEIVIFLL